MIIRDIGILGMGLWEGEVITNERFAKQALQNAEVKDPYRGRRDERSVVRIAGMEFTPEKHARTLAAIERSFKDPYRGTKRRRYFPADLKISEAETDAARRALADANISPSDVGAILVQSFISDQLQPRNAPLIAHNLGIHHAPAWEVDSICNSLLTHIIVGSHLIKSGLAKYILCTQSVAYSRVMDPNSASAVLEGDMAAAFVLGPSPGTRISHSWRTDGRLHAAIRLGWGVPSGAPTRSYLMASQERLLIHFDPVLQQEVNHEIAEHAVVVCNEALSRFDAKLDDMDIFISHQPMSWFAEFMEDVLGLRNGVTFSTFEEYGCVNSASLSASLHDARKAGRVRKGTKLLMFGPAAGYQYGSVAMEW